MRLFPKLLVLATLCVSPLLADHHLEGEWVSLFDGKSTSGWKNPYTWGEIKVQDEEIHLTADKKFFLITEKDYENFVFEGEINLPEGQANSGFMFRCHVEPNKVFGYPTTCLLFDVHVSLLARRSFGDDWDGNHSFCLPVFRFGT